MFNPLRLPVWLFVISLCTISHLCLGQSYPQARLWYFSTQFLQFYTPGYGQPSVFTNYNNPSGSQRNFPVTSTFSNYPAYIAGQGGAIYGSNGTVVDALSGYVSPTRTTTPGSNDPIIYGNQGPETIIVPVPGSCAKFYAFNNLFAPLSAGAVVRATIDCSNPTPVVSDKVIVNEGSSDTGIAVSRAKPDGTRYLYTADILAITRYTITSTGVSAGVTVATLPSNPFVRRLDLSPDGTQMGFADYFGHRVYVADVNPSNGTVSNVRYQTFSGYTPTDVEFSPDSKNMYFTYDGNGSNGGTSGVGKWNLTSNTVQASLPNSQGFGSYSQIELAYDGLFYLTTQTQLSSGQYQVGTLDPATDTFSIPNSTIGVGLAVGLNAQFPDQVDGEDYSYFYGVQQPVLTDLQVQNKLINTATIDYPNVYTCQAIPLTANTANIATYQVELTVGNYFSTSYYYSTPPLTSLPTDLRTLDNGYLQTHPGKYGLTVSAYNQCGVVARIVTTIYVNSSPNTANYAYLTGQSFNTAPSTNPNQPLEVGSQGVTLVLNPYGAPSTLGADYAYVVIEKYTASTGATSPVCQGGISIPSSREIQVNLNNLVSPCVGNNYFSGYIGAEFRLTMTLYNPCGTATTVSYFRPVSNAYRTPNPLATQDAKSTTEWEVYPNPATDKLHISLPNSVAVKQAKLYTILGQAVQTAPVLQGGELDVTGVAAGVYLLKVETSNGTLHKRVEIAH